MEKIHNGRFIRMTPNMPSLFPGYDACVFSRNSQCAKELASRMFSCLEFCSQNPEYRMDTVTDLSGSGPTGKLTAGERSEKFGSLAWQYFYVELQLHVFTVIRALTDGEVKMGLPKDLALKLSAQTGLGAAKMVLASGEHPAVLRGNATNPGGTTIHGLNALEQGGIRSALINAVEIAARRSGEMGQPEIKKHA